MPKKPADNVNINRIEFQNSERGQIDKIANSIAFKNYMTPLVEIAKDNTLFYFVLVPLLASLAGILGFTWLYVGRDDLKTAKDVFDDFMATYDNARANGTIAAATTTLFATIPFGNGFLQNQAQENPQQVGAILADIDLVGIATDPMTYIDPIIQAADDLRPNNPFGVNTVLDPVAGGVDSLLSYLGGLVD